MSQIPLIRFTHRRLHFRGRNLSKEEMPRIYCAGEGGNGGVQLWGRSDSRTEFLDQKCNQWGVTATEVPWCPSSGTAAVAGASPSVWLYGTGGILPKSLVLSLALPTLPVIR